MLRFAKWALIPAVICLAATFGSANEAQAGGWGISINSGYPGYYGYGAPIYAPAYGPAFGYGYRTYGFYGAAPLYRYPAYYPPAVSFSFGGGGGGGHYHHHGRHCR